MKVVGDLGHFCLGSAQRAEIRGTRGWGARWLNLGSGCLGTSRRARTAGPAPSVGSSLGMNRGQGPLFGVEPASFPSPGAVRREGGWSLSGLSLVLGSGS